MKLAYITEAKGLAKYPNPHRFQKPWFLTSLCFFAMFWGLPIYAVYAYWKHRQGSERWVLVHRLGLKNFCEFVFAAASDAFEQTVSAVCIVFVGVSFDSMMKSGTLIGVSVIARWLFKQHYHRWQWIAIALVVIALTTVGAAGIIGAGKSSTIIASRFWVGVILALKFVSQVGYAVRISYEEYFVQKKFYHPVLICGCEGFWTFLITGIIGETAAYFLPGKEGNGIHEDIVDTFVQIGNSVTLIVLCIVSFLLGLIYNSVSTTLIGRTSAVIRTLMEAFRTFLIWMVQFAMFYGFKSNPHLFKYRFAGEEWTFACYIQATGFALMIFALCMYNAIPKYPCFNYGPVHVNEEAKLEATPTLLEEQRENVLGAM
jgi:hypothetical protein